MDTPWVCRSLTEPLHDNAASMAVGYKTKKFLNFGGGRISRGRFCAIARGSWLQQTFTDQPSHQQRRALDSERVTYLAAMKVHGSRAEMETSSNVSAGQSIRHEQSDFQLPGLELHASVATRTSRR
jgi:hypothetical protein